MNRRDLISLIGAGLTAGAVTRWPGRGSTLAFGPPRRAPSRGFAPDIDLVLTAAPGDAQILPGAPSRVLRYSARLVAGAADTIQEVPGSYLGPTIRVRKGQHVRIRFVNALDEPSIVHWHGLDVPEAADGHPRFAVAPGSEYLYEFQVLNRAGTYWYHPHPHGTTGRQVYGGLAGLFIVADEEEDALALPAGAADLVVVLQDRRFDARNQLTHLAGGMMDQIHGLLGDRMFVNGAERPTWSLATRAYRLRLLNGSSSRVYKLAWDDGTPMVVIATDGGLLDRPVQQRYVTLGPAQRADVILDLSRHAVGSTVQLRSAPFPAGEVSLDGGGMPGMMGAMGGADVPNGAPLSLLTLRVSRRETVAFRLPAQLAAAAPPATPGVTLPPRRITLAFQAGQWQLAGRTFEMDAVAPDEIVPAGARQIWEIVNVSGMMGMRMAHPFHVHGTQFRVAGRTPPDGQVVVPGSVREGLLDAGWRDTVLVMPGDTVRLEMRFTRYAGLFLYHCHVLEHEDMGMMRNYRVTA